MNLFSSISSHIFADILYRYGYVQSSDSHQITGWPAAEAGGLRKS